MRLAGITIPDDKRIEIALTAIYGIGRTQAKAILEKVKVDVSKKTSEVSEADEKKIRAEIDQMKVEGDLKREVSGNIKRLKDINANRGIRHSRNLTLRGQRTKTNARTVPSGISAKNRKRVTMGSGRVKVDKK